MKVVIQRVSRASVNINGEMFSAIKSGLLLFIGIEHSDEVKDVDWLINKVVNLRIFPDDQKIMNLSLLQVNGDVLVVSQFTLHANTKKGNRPSYIRAANPDHALPLYNYFTKRLSEVIGKEIKTGKFGADMQVELINTGPITIIIDSQNKE